MIQNDPGNFLQIILLSCTQGRIQGRGVNPPPPDGKISSICWGFCEKNTKPLNRWSQLNPFGPYQKFQTPPLHTHKNSAYAPDCTFLFKK